MRRAALAGVLLALLALQPVPGVAAADATLCGGDPYRFDDEDLRIPEGDTLTLCPGTTLRGTANVVVNGTLRAHGTAADPIRLDLTVLVNPTGNASLRWTHHGGVPGPAVHVAGGEVALEDVTLAGNREGLRVEAGRANATNATFRDHGQAALVLAGPGRLAVANATFSDDALALRVRAGATAGTATLANITVRGGAALDARVTHRPLPQLTLRGADLDGQDLPPGTALVHLDGEVPESPAEHPLLVLEESALRRAPLGLHAEGAGYRVQSQRNTYEGNTVGARLEGPRVTLFRDTLDNVRWDLMILGPPDHVRPVETTLHPDRVCLGANCTAPAAATPPADPLLSPTSIVPVGVGFLAAFLLALATVGRDALRATALRAYERLGPDAARDPDLRDRVRRVVVNHPGATLDALHHLLDLPRPTLRLHLQRLEEAGRVTHLPEEGATRWYATAFERPDEPAPSDPLPPPRPPDPGELPREVQGMEREVYVAILRGPGRSQADVAQELDLTRQAVHYHIKKLEDRGLVRKERQGRETRCYPAAPGG